MAPSRVPQARSPFFVCLLTVLQLNEFYSLNVKPKLHCLHNTNLTCRDLLSPNSCTPDDSHLLSCSESKITDAHEDSTNISYIIDNTILNQPAVWLTVESGTYKVEESRDLLLIGTSVYVVGYRCTSNPGKTCYISHELPGVDDWMHTVIPAGGMNHTVNVGDQCTFFVCFKYCKPISGGCKRLHRNLPGRNITILANCSNEMDNIKNGDVVYSQGKTHQGKYPEHTTGTITCDEGYIVSGNNITTCQNDGTWSSIPSCEIVDCGNLPIPSNINTTQFLQNETIFNSTITATYECKEGYLPPGNIAISHTCNSDGRWSNTFECLECSEAAVCGEKEECRVTNGTAVCIPKTCSFKDCHLQKWIILIVMLGLLLLLPLVIIMCTTVIYRQYENYKNDEVRKYRNIKWQAHEEVLDPSYTPIDVSPRKRISITLSFDELSEYKNTFDPPSVWSEEPHHTKTPGPGSMLEVLGSNSALDRKIENDDEEEDFHTITDTAIDDEFPRQNAHSGVSLHLTDSSCAYVYSNKQDIETKAVSCIESTEMELPSLSCEFPVKPYLNHDTCLSVDVVEAMPNSPYINDCPNSEQSGSNHDITVSSSHDSPTDASLAFELVNGAIHTTTSGHSPSSGYVCDSSDVVPSSESTITTPSPASTPSPELPIAMSSSVATITPELNNVIPEQDTTPYVTSEQLQSHHCLLPKDWTCSNDHSSPTSSNYDFHFPAPKIQSSPNDISPSHSYKIQDLGGGYVDIM